MEGVLHVYPLIFCLLFGSFIYSSIYSFIQYLIIPQHITVLLPRVKMFADAVDSQYIFKAGKPGREGYRRAMERMGTQEATTVFVGDQLFTDVWGAKRTGIVTYLVKPIHPAEEIQIVLKRYLEKIVLFFYHRSVNK